MAPRGKFVMSKRWAASVLHRDPGLQAAIRGIAKDGADKAGGHVEEYHTDRFVAAIVVGAEDQANGGAATKAAGELGLPIRNT
jgi:hypothetical protein